MKATKVSIVLNPKIKRMDEIERDIRNIIDSYGATIVPCGKETEMIISIGGDGTVLKSFRMLYSMEIPLLGLNFGKFGFLTIDCKDMAKTIKEAVK